MRQRRVTAYGHNSEYIIFTLLVRPRHCPCVNERGLIVRPVQFFSESQIVSMRQCAGVSDGDEGGCGLGEGGGDLEVEGE
jgi:hypothetical protein